MPNRVVVMWGRPIEREDDCDAERSHVYILAYEARAENEHDVYEPLCCLAADLHLFSEHIDCYDEQPPDACPKCLAILEAVRKMER